MVGMLKATSVNNVTLLESTMEYNVMRDCRSVRKEIGTTVLVGTLKGLGHEKEFKYFDNNE